MIYDPFGYTIAAYLRLSEHDDSRDESNSITNQRAMIKNYITSKSEFADANLIDYVDDGISGSHTERKAYQRLMADINCGAVHCIVVKDLSRIGRDLIDVGDLLMNFLVVQGIRFIAINNHYDSLKNPLSNLELAVINLANQHYNRDLAQKSISSKTIKMKRGEFISPWAIYGYKKSETERNKIVIDAESAKYVRMIFSLATDGNNTVQIAKILNAQGVLTPSEYKKRQGVSFVWKTIDPEYFFWCDSGVGRILNDIRYTGVSVHNKRKAIHAGSTRCVQRPADEWIVIPDAHEAIVSKAEYDKAHEAIRREKLSGVPMDHIFHGKIKCPVCNRTLKRSNTNSPLFKCQTYKFTDHYDCPDFSMPQAKIEEIVLESVKIHVAVLVDQEELKLAAIQQEGISKAGIESKIKMESRAVKTLESSITKNITDLVSGKISQDGFLSKKEIINATIAKKNTELEKLRGQLKALSEGKASINQRLLRLRPILAVDKLDRGLVDLLIDKVLIHGEREIEIVWFDRW